MENRVQARMVCMQKIGWGGGCRLLIGTQSLCGVELAHRTESSGRARDAQEHKTFVGISGDTGRKLLRATLNAEGHGGGNCAEGNLNCSVCVRKRSAMPRNLCSGHSTIWLGPWRNHRPFSQPAANAGAAKASLDGVCAEGGGGVSRAVVRGFYPLSLPVPRTMHFNASLSSGANFARLSLLCLALISMALL